MAFISTALTVLALVVAWTTFRLERFSSRRHDIAGARAVVSAVQRGMTEGMPELDARYQGWGEIYFTTVYDRRTALLRANQAAKAVEARGWDQVFVVPTEPLALLATTASDLISQETIFAANFALWRVKVFNQFVDAQSAFNARHAAEIMDQSTSQKRLLALAVAARGISEGMHFDGIGSAGSAEGWYTRLKDAVESDIKRLREMEEEGFWTWRRGSRHLVVGDVLAMVLAAVVIIAGVVFLAFRS